MRKPIAFRGNSAGGHGHRVLGRHGVSNRDDTTQNLQQSQWTVAASAAPAAPAQDDLEKYLALPAETNMDLDVLEWWKGKAPVMPNLAKMARQFLGRPASSAGVERMFSKAGKLYDDTKKGQNDGTLENALFAAANTE